MDTAPSFRDYTKSKALGVVAKVVGAVALVGWMPVYVLLLLKSVRGTKDPKRRMMPEEEQDAETSESGPRVHHGV